MGNVNFWDSGIGKTARALVYVFVSTGLLGLLTHLQESPDTLGTILTGVAIAGINGLLVLVKQLRDPHTPNLPR